MDGSSAVGAGTPVSDSPVDGSDEVVLLVSSVSCAAGRNLRFFIAFATASAAAASIICSAASAALVMHRTALLPAWRMLCLPWATSLASSVCISLFISSKRARFFSPRGRKESSLASRASLARFSKVFGIAQTYGKACELFDLSQSFDNCNSHMRVAINEAIPDHVRRAFCALAQATHCKRTCFVETTCVGNGLRRSAAIAC